MSEAENSSLCSFQKEGNDAPPPLSIELPNLSDLPGKSQPWCDDQLPVDIVLLTVEDCEFLACYAYMRNCVKRYHVDLGRVYFGCMGDDDDDDPLKVALLKCSAGSSEPGGAQTVARNAVMKLKPKAIFSVGCCEGLKPENTQLGDVVISPTLTTKNIKTPVGKYIADLIKSVADGWNPPLEGPDARQVHVHRDGEILSCIDKETAKSHPRAIAREMEGKGIFVADHDLKMEWMIVKGISHFADSSKTPDESWKSHACVMAASLVFKMLNDTQVFKQWPHYEDLSVEEESSASQLKRELPRSSSHVPKRIKISDLSAEEESSARLPCSCSHDAKRKKIPEAFPLEKCQERLKSKYDDMSYVTITPWDPNCAVHIDKIYTRLSWCKADVKPRGKMKEKLEDYTDIFTCQEHRNPKRLLVYGRPGIGKSTFCKKAAYDWSQQSKPILRKFDLVVLVKLRDVCNLHHVSAILKASELLANDSNISVDSLCNYIQENQDKVLLILDGYDEYSCDGIRESPVRDIWERNQLSECTVLLTMRPTHELKSHLWFEINGFDSEDQVKMFSQKFLKDESDVEEFYKYLKEHDLNEIAEIPLLLRMLCLLWTEKDLTRNLTSRANIYTRFTQTMLDHLSEKEDEKQFKSKEVDEYAEEFSKLGKFAYDALLKGNLTLLKSELSDDLQKIVNKFIKVGLCHAFKPSRVDPKEEVSFIHKTIQEYIASRHLKELAISTNDKEATFLPELDSIEKILKVKEVLEFASELSECSARVILNHLWRVAKHDDLTSSLETIIAMKTPSLIDLKDLSIEEENFLMLTVHTFCCCSAESRQNLSPSVLLIDSKQLHRIANQHLLKSTEPPNLITFLDELSNHSDRDYRDLITVMEDLNAVVESCSGVEKASRFLKKYPVRPIREFFLKKEENMHLYFGVVDNYKIVSSPSPPFPFPTEMLKELIASPESTAQKRKKSDAHQSSEQNTRTAACSTQDTDSPFYPTRHCLSLVWCINALESSEIEREVLTEMMPLVIEPRYIYLDNAGLQLIESIHITDKLRILNLEACLTVDMSAIIATFLHQTTNLYELSLSDNVLGEGVSVLTRLFSCVPDLEILYLNDVFMTKKQVYDLTTAVHQRKFFELHSLYHDINGNPLPEDQWPSEDYWNERPWLVPSEAEDESGSSAESEDEPETSAKSEDQPGSSAESKNESESSAESQEKDVEGNLNKQEPLSLDEVFQVLKEMGEYSSDEEKPVVMD